MVLEILGTALDIRTNTPVIYAQTDVVSYLEIVGRDFYNFSIQRRREKFTAYARLKNDIVAGTLLPTITLAVPIMYTHEIQEVFNTGDRTLLKNTILQKLPLNILDGLQRTFILRDLANAGHQFPPEQKIHLEIRMEPDLDHLIYRIIVLNAGQKQMSMRHQIEILSLSLKNTLTSNIPGLELLPEVEGGRRTRARRFSLDRIANGYHAFLIRSPEVDKQNLVAQRLSEETVLEQDVDQFGIQFNEFLEAFKQYCDIDDVAQDIAPSEETTPTITNWLGGENTINSFFAAVADFGTTPERKGRVRTAISKLTDTIRSSQSDSIVGLSDFNRIVTGFPSRKTNIGYATRKLIFVSFKEYFRENGETPLAEIWEKEAE